ncbi:uncharacterized protein LOC112548243 isoform X2 [Alligator sinensis]|uniref:Uncharacterized protein LOC112548243 isoform X2 n=1 Tax=Alligator sinensis TaxID=38654 RepID=A0A3Q0FPF1_ALLSI|nr:uncharacterized protein LOC112548243 isoform X2 [Alligator sinensis]
MTGQIKSSFGAKAEQIEPAQRLLEGISGHETLFSHPSGAGAVRSSFTSKPEHLELAERTVPCCMMPPFRTQSTVQRGKYGRRRPGCQVTSPGGVPISSLGGFLFKQWKEKFLFLALDGSLIISRDAQSPAELGISLGTSCRAILEGRELGDLPRLPGGARPDSCLGLSLSDGRVLLLLAPDSQVCRQWLNVLRKVKESFSQGSPTSCRLHIRSPARTCCWTEAGGGNESPGAERREAPTRTSQRLEKRSAHCLRHGSPALPGVRAACLLMGSAAAGPTMGYMVTSAPTARPTEALPPDFKELGYHPSACDPEAAPYDALDYEGLDQDFDAPDFGGFAF